MSKMEKELERIISEEDLEALRCTNVTLRGPTHRAIVKGRVGHNGADVKGYYVYDTSGESFWGGGRFGSEIQIKSGDVLDWTEFHTKEIAPNCSVVETYRVIGKVSLRNEGGTYDVS